MADGKHELALTNGGARWLCLYLNSPGIFVTTADVFNIGVLLNSHLESAINEKRKEVLEGDGWEVWGKEAYPPFEITENQRDAIKRGLKSLADKGHLQVNKFTIELLPIFGLSQ